MRPEIFPTSGINVFLPATAVVLATLLIAGCATQNYRGDPGRIYHGYDGSRLPKDQVAAVWWDKIHVSSEVVNINGHPLYSYEEKRRHYMGAHLLPGDNTFEFSVGCYKCAPALIRMDADLVAGHVYEFRVEYRYKARHARHYAARLVDTTSGELVAGRPPEVLKWSWADWEYALQKLKRSSASEKKVIELLSEPFFERPSDHTLVYVSCPEFKEGIVDWYVMQQTADTDGCGFLFLEFTPSKRLEEYIFLEVPFYECYQNRFTAWDWRAAHARQKICRYRIKRVAFAEFLAITGKPYEAYLELEDGFGFISDHHEEELLRQSRMLLRKYPEVFRAAKAHFTKRGFEQSAMDYGDHAESIEHKRLSIYQKLAHPDDYEKAEREFHDFFEIRLNQ